MSGGTVYRRALQLATEDGLAGEAEREVIAALEAARLDPLLQLLYEAAHEAGLAREGLLLRAAGCFLSFAAGNLADDLIDGDCDYLEDAFRFGPSTQFFLQHLGYRAWLTSGAPRDAVVRAATSLARATGPNHVEVRTTSWTAPVFQLVGEHIAGRQWQGYLEVLWAGTALEEQASAVGRAIGVLGHLVEDTRTGDPRWTTLPDDDKAAVLAWAEGYATTLRASGSRTAEYILRGTALVLGEDFAP